MENRKNRLNIDYKPESTQESIAAALTWLRDEETKKNIRVPEGVFNASRLSNACSFAIFSPDGKSLGTYYNQPCHAMLSGYNIRGERDAIALWMKQDVHENDKLFRDYFEKRSFCSDYILASHENGVVISVDIPAGLAHAIAMVSRLPRMVPERHFVWFNNLVEKGIPEDVAFNVAFNSTYADDGDVFWRSSDHRVWPCPGLKGLKRQLSGKFKGLDSPKGKAAHYRATVTTRCAHFVYDDYENGLTHDLFRDKDIEDAVMTFRRSKVSPEMYRPPNPFVKSDKPPLRKGDMTIEELHNIALPLAVKKGLFDV